MSETRSYSAARQDRRRRDRIPPDVPGGRSRGSGFRAETPDPRLAGPAAQYQPAQSAVSLDHRNRARRITSLLAVKDGAVVGCGTLVRDPHSWSPHVGEIRMVVSQDVRGQGVGRALAQERFALALGAGLEKLSVQMTVDQQAAITL